MTLLQYPRNELHFTSAPDYESQQSYTLVLTASDGTNVTDQTVSIEILDGNDAPYFDNAWRDADSELIDDPNFTVNENSEGQFGSFSVVDPEGDDLTLSISGVDIEILDGNGLQFIVPPDYESQALYDAIITVSDGEFSAEQQITVTVLNENDNAQR